MPFPPSIALRRMIHGLLALPLLVAGCASDRPEARVVVRRFVDPALRATALATPPDLVTMATPLGPLPSTLGLLTATLDCRAHATETRPVLATHRQALLGYLVPTLAPDDDVLAVGVTLPPTWPTTAGVVVDLHARVEGVWRHFPPRWVAVEAEGVTRRVDTTVPAPGVRRGSSVQMSTDIYLAPVEGRTTYVTPPIDIPADGMLEVAAGILPPAAEQGAVRFSIAGCEGSECIDLFATDVDPRGRDAGCWHELRVPLDRLSGRRLALRFETRHLAAGPGRYTLPVWADPVISVPARQAAPTPSIVLISIDTLRADHLGVYGYRRGTSPFLDRFAARGVVFENLISEAATTDPSHMTMFTSLPAAVHGVTSGMKPLAVPAITLAEALRGRGYRTAAFTEDGPLAHDRGFARGFDIYGENASADLMSPDGRVTRTFGQARAWLEAGPSTPFFLFVHTFQVHAPYSPPLAYRRYFLTDGDAWVDVPPERGAQHAEAEHAARNYDREIRFVDDELERLLQWMEATGLLERTIVVILSDHGEQFYEHGGLGHGTLPYEQVLRPPFIVVGPGVPAGRRIAETVAHLDVMPTLLDLAGAPHPPALQGESVVPLMLGRLPTGPARAVRPAFSSSWVLPENLLPPALAVRIGSRKLMKYRTARGEHYEYYDLASDPAERHDLWAEQGGAAADLRAVLEQREGALAAIQQSLTGGAAIDATPPPLDPGREEKLRSLGYLR